MGIYNDIMNSIGLSNRNQINEANKTLEDIATSAGNVNSQNVNLLNGYLTKMRDMYGSNADKYNSYLSSLEGAMGDNADQFTPSGSIDNFYDKFQNQRVASAMNGIADSMANAGNMFSSDYLNRIGAKQQALATEAYKDAQNSYNDDVSRQMSIFNTNANAKNNFVNNLANLTNLYGQDRNNLANSYSEGTSNLINSNNAYAQALAEIKAQQAQNNANKTNGIGSLLSLATLLK